MADKHFIAQLKGYCLTTAEILYHMPDHPALLQSFIWQDYDLAPRFPKLLGFLEFWNGNLDGKVNRVEFATNVSSTRQSSGFWMGGFCFNRACRLNFCAWKSHWKRDIGFRLNLEHRGVDADKSGRLRQALHETVLKGGFR